MLPERAAAPLREYVRTGGTLVAEARLGWNNEKGVAADRIPGMGLWEVMGCRETDVQTGAKGRTTLTWTGGDSAISAAGASIPARWYEETLEPLSPDARVVAKFPNGAAAAVESKYGKGRTLMLGSYVSAAYQTSPSDEAARFFAGLLAWAGVAEPVQVTGGSPQEIEVKMLESGSDILLFVFQHGSGQGDVVVTPRMSLAGYAVSDLVTGARVEVGSGNRLRKRLNARDVWVLRLRPSAAGN